MTGAARGGSRKGAGRKPGSATKKTREIADKALAEGISPLEFMLEIMRSEAPASEDARIQVAHQAMRFEAAKAAAPYVHPKLAAVEVTGRDGKDLIPTNPDHMTDEQLAAIAAGSGSAST